MNRHALGALRFAAEADEGFAFEVEDFVFRDVTRGAADAAAEDDGELAGDLRVVLRGVAAGDERVDHHAEGRAKTFAIATDVLLGAAIVSAVTTVVLYASSREN